MSKINRERAIKLGVPGPTLSAASAAPSLVAGEEISVFLWKGPKGRALVPEEGTAAIMNIVAR